MMSDLTTNPNYSISLNLTNTHDTEISIFLEPWGERYSMKPGCMYLLKFQAPIIGPLEIEYGLDHVTVFAWESSSVRIFQDDIELGAGNGPRNTVLQVP